EQEAECPHHEKPDVDGERRVAGLERDRDPEPQRREHRQEDERRQADQGALRSSSRSDSRASIASSFMAGSIACGLNFARSNSSVSRSTEVIEAPISGSTRPRYSRGASAGVRGSPASA